MRRARTTAHARVFFLRLPSAHSGNRNRLPLDGSSAASGSWVDAGWAPRCSVGRRRRAISGLKGGARRQKPRWRRWSESP